MIGLDQLFALEVVHRLGWTLLHSLWQGALVAGVLALLLVVIPSTKPNVRYAAGFLSLLVILVLCGVTYCVVDTPTPSVTRPLAIADLEPDEPPVPSEAPVSYLATAQSNPGVVPSNISSGTGPTEPWRDRVIDFTEPLLPWCVLLWGLGVFALSAWRLGGWIAMHRLRTIGTSPTTDEVTALVKRLSERLRISRPVRALQSVVIQMPAVIGHFRPVILLPISALTGLSSEQIEAIIAHELAHIRRYDYLVIILQTAIETLLFHHPAVWWISHRIRAEREHCCDDLAVSVCGSAVVYAEALTELVALRGHSPQLAAAATGGPLFERIRRIVKLPPNQPAHVSRSIAGVVLIGVLLFSGIALSVYSKALEARADTTKRLSVAQPSKDKKPFIVYGKVMDDQGRPMADVQIIANAGLGTLRRTGSTVTGPDGNYKLHFGRGLLTLDDSLLRAAVVRPEKEGFYEKNLHHQGALKIAGERPPKNNAWKVDPDEVLLPGQERQVDFVMLPAALIKGQMVDAKSKPVDGKYLSIPANVRPPACSVLAGAETDEDGEFVISVPPKSYVFSIHENRLVLLSDPADFTEPGTYRVQLVYDKSPDKGSRLLCRVLSRTGDPTIQPAGLDPTETVERFFKEAVAGNNGAAVRFAHPRSAIPQQIDDIPEMLGPQNVTIKRVYADERHALAISSTIKADHGRVGPLVIRLLKQGQNWLIRDIDVETEQSAEEELDRFRQRYPEAESILDQPTTQPATDSKLTPEDVQHELAKLKLEFAFAHSQQMKAFRSPEERKGSYPILSAGIKLITADCYHEYYAKHGFDPPVSYPGAETEYYALYRRWQSLDEKKTAQRADCVKRLLALVDEKAASAKEEIAKTIKESGLEPQAARAVVEAGKTRFLAGKRVNAPLPHHDQRIEPDTFCVGFLKKHRPKPSGVGSIAGTVTDADGRPAKGAMIYIRGSDDRDNQGMAQSDEKGHFKIAVPLRQGKYFVSAFKGESWDTHGTKGEPAYLMGYRHDVQVKQGQVTSIALKPLGTATLNVTLAPPDPYHLEWGVIFLALSPINLGGQRPEPKELLFPNDLLAFVFVQPGKPLTIHNVPAGKIHVRATPSDPGPMDFSPSTPVEIKPGGEQAVTLRLQPRSPLAIKPAATQPAETFNSVETRLEFDKISLDQILDQFVVSGGKWTVENGELVGTCAGDRSWATYRTHFKRLNSVLIRARIVPPSTQNLRIWVGPILLIFNWELADQNHYRNVHELTITSPHALTPGTLHDIELRQMGSNAIVAVDGKVVHETAALLHGTVSVQSAWGSTVAIQQIKILGEPDPSVQVGPLTKNLPDSPPARSDTRVDDTHRVEGDLEFGKRIAVKVKSPAGDSQVMAETRWVEFIRSQDQVKAKLQVGYPSGPKAKWRAKIELLERQGKVLASTEIVFENSGLIKGIAKSMQKTLEFRLGTWDEVSAATRFAVTIDQLAGPGLPPESATLEIPDGIEEGQREKWLGARLPEGVEPAALKVRYEIEGGEKKARLRLRFMSWTGLGFAIQHLNVANGGEILLTNLTPGRYNLARIKQLRNGNFGKDVYCDRESNLLLEPGKTALVDLVRPSGQPITGRISGLPENVVPCVFVYIKSAEATGDPMNSDELWLRTFDAVTCKVNGDFKTERIPPGTYSVIAEAYKELERRGHGWQLPDYVGATKVEVPKEGPTPRVHVEMKTREEFRKLLKKSNPAEIEILPAESEQPAASQPIDAHATAHITFIHGHEEKQDAESVSIASGQYMWRINRGTPVRLVHGWYTIIDGKAREHVGGGTNRNVETGPMSLGLNVAIEKGMLELDVRRAMGALLPGEIMRKAASLNSRTEAPGDSIFVTAFRYGEKTLTSKYTPLWEGHWVRGGEIVKRIVYVVRVATHDDPTTVFDKHELQRALAATRLGGPQTLPTTAPAAEPSDHLQEQANRDAFTGHAETSRFLMQGGKRDEAAKRFRAIAHRSPQSKYGRIADELANLLAQMAEEDEQYPEPGNPASLSEQQRIKYYVFKLRDVAEQSLYTPGTCRVLFYPHTPNSAAVALRKIGKPAIPVMLDLLNDPRPTRSYAAELIGNHLLRYSDLALEIIEAIACRQFDSRPGGRGAYLSNADQATRALIIARARTWWRENKARTESQWIRESLSETGIGAMWNRLESAERLIELEGARSIAFFRKRLKAEPDSPHLARLLFKAGGKTVLDDIRAMTSNKNTEVREAAERVLRQILEADAQGNQPITQPPAD